VVKPADGTAGGHGVTTGISSTSALHAASWNAAGLHAANSNLLVEEQLTGASFRLLYLDGEFIDAVRRDSPVVVGDGKSTIRQLVNAENTTRRTSRPISALSPLTIDQESRNTLAAQGKSPGSVPAAGETVRVKLAVNENASAQNHVVRNEVHEEIVRAGSQLVRELNIGLGGLDVTSHDISAPLAKGDTIFNEINVPPGIHHHYLVANPEDGADVASIVLERMFSTHRGVIEL
jgi:cyanophycin synthetase